MCFQSQRQAQQGWQEVSTNIPAFYKSYQDLRFLASVLGVDAFRNTIDNVVKNHIYKIATIPQYSTLTFFVNGYRKNNSNGWYFFGRIYNQAFTLQTYIRSEYFVPDLFYKFEGGVLEIYARVQQEYPGLAYLNITDVRVAMSFEDYGTDPTGLTPFFT